jgi:hypothetical protein
MFSQDQPAQQLTNLHTLNVALMRLNPQITGIDTSTLQTRGTTVAILNAVIAADALTLYNGIKRADVINAIKPPLALAVNNTPSPTPTIRMATSISPAARREQSSPEPPSSSIHSWSISSGRIWGASGAMPTEAIRPTT